MKCYTRWILGAEDITDPKNVMFKVNGKWIGPRPFDSLMGPDIEEVRQAKRAIFHRKYRLAAKVKKVLRRRQHRPKMRKLFYLLK